MTSETNDKLLCAWAFCDLNDKSTDYMLEYMQKVANVDLDCVLSFIKKTTIKKRQEYNRNLSKKQLGCGYCAIELECKKKDAKINKAKQGCEQYKHFSN